jgi:hypothetical protein
MEINMSKHIKSVAIGLLLSGSAMTCFAAGTVTSTVNFVQVNSPNRAYVQFNTAPSGSPACATDPRMHIDLTTDAGKAMYSMALTAKASGKQLFSAGMGTCYSKFEKVNYMRLL